MKKKENRTCKSRATQGRQQLAMCLPRNMTRRGTTTTLAMVARMWMQWKTNIKIDESTICTQTGIGQYIILRTAAAAAAAATRAPGTQTSLQWNFSRSKLRFKTAKTCWHLWDSLQISLSQILYALLFFSSVFFFCACLSFLFSTRRVAFPLTLTSTDAFWTPSSRETPLLLCRWANTMRTFRHKHQLDAV